MPIATPAFAAELVPAVDARFRTSSDRGQRANVGMGFWAQDAAVVTFQNPESFGRVGIQSYYAVDEMVTALLDAMGEHDFSRAAIEEFSKV